MQRGIKAFQHPSTVREKIEPHWMREIVFCRITLIDKESNTSLFGFRKIMSYVSKRCKTVILILRLHADAVASRKNKTEITFNNNTKRDV